MNLQTRNKSLIEATARRLREVRESCGMSQEKVLFQTGIYLSYIENARRNINVSTLITLCKTYGISMKEFFKDLAYDQTQSK